jgi:hypothetical protein
VRELVPGFWLTAKLKELLVVAAIEIQVELDMGCHAQPLSTCTESDCVPPLAGTAWGIAIA